MLTQRAQRRYRHVTPRYVVDRMQDRRYRRMNPDDPWLTPEAVRFIASSLRDTDHALEVGSGRSTAWIAARVSTLTSIESDSTWFERVEQMLRAAELGERVTLVHATDTPGHVDTIAGIDDASLDFCLIDGKFRGVTALAAIPKLRPGGLLVVDDVHRYLPDDRTRSPYARRSTDGCADRNWEEFASATSRWRNVRTSSGVKDTGLWIRPAA